MRIVFLSTPGFAIPVAEWLDQRFSRNAFAALYTQPDIKAGRGLKLKAPAVKDWALEKGIVVEQPQIWDQACCRRLASYQADLLITLAYGQILPVTALHSTKHGAINIHTSLLPRWRGAAPVVRAIEAGDTQTGVSLMCMEEGLDSGAIIQQSKCAIEEQDTAGSLTEKLMRLACELLEHFFLNVEANLAQAQAQKEEDVCYAHKVKKNERMIDWNQNARMIDKKIRAFNPTPLAQTFYHGKVLNIIQARCSASNDTSSKVSGLCTASKQGIEVQCGEGGALCIEELQLAGSKRMAATDFARGHSIDGYVLGH